MDYIPGGGAAPGALAVFGALFALLGAVYLFAGLRDLLHAGRLRREEPQSVGSLSWGPCLLATGEVTTGGAPPLESPADGRQSAWVHGWVQAPPGKELRASSGYRPRRLVLEDGAGRVEVSRPEMVALPVRGWRLTPALRQRLEELGYEGPLPKEGTYRERRLEPGQRVFVSGRMSFPPREGKAGLLEAATVSERPEVLGGRSLHRGLLRLLAALPALGVGGGLVYLVVEQAGWL